MLWLLYDAFLKPSPDQVRPSAQLKTKRDYKLCNMPSLLLKTWDWTETELTESISSIPWGSRSQEGKDMRDLGQSPNDTVDTSVLTVVLTSKFSP
jgi:hypothetical protein